MTPPKAVRWLVEDLRKACETDPEVSWDETHVHWRITMSNDRVVMTLDHKMTPGGRWVWANSTLSIDGVRGPLSSGFEHFVRIWKNPEELVNKSPVPPPAASTPIQVVPLDSMPEYIVLAINQVVGKNGLTDPEVGYVDDIFWAIEFTFPRASLRVHWSKTNSSGRPDSVSVIIDGEDKSDLVEGNMEKALAMISQIPHPGAAGTASITGEAKQQRDRGVEVRSTHVIRT